MSLGGNTAQFGYKSWISIGQEATFGTITAGETATAYTEFYTCSLKKNIEMLKIESLNTQPYPKRLMSGNETIEGSIEMDLNVASDAQVYLIKQAFGGTVSSASITAGQADFQHTFNIGDMDNNDSTSGSADVEGLTIDVQLGDTSTSLQHFWGCRVNQLTIKGEVGSPVKMTVDLLGKCSTVTSENRTVSFTNINPLHFTGVSISTGNTISALSSTSIISFEWTLKNNLVGDTNARALGSPNVKILPPSTRESTLKLKMRFDTMTAYNYYVALSAMAIQIEMESPSIVASTGSVNYNMTLKCPKCYLDANPLPEIGEKGIITANLSYTLYLDTTSTYYVQATIDNATANY